MGVKVSRNMLRNALGIKSPNVKIKNLRMRADTPWKGPSGGLGDADSIMPPISQAPPISMPRPSQPTNRAVTQVSSSGQPAGQSGGGALSRGLAAMRGGGAAISGAMSSVAASQTAGTVGLIGASALAGGTTSYATGGSFMQGAVTGGIGGAALGLGGAAAMRRGLGHMSGEAQKHLKHYGYADAAQSVASFSSGMSSMAGNMSTTTARRAAFGAGAMLGGYAFGGNRSHKRGFNSNRGNSFGR